MNAAARLLHRAPWVVKTAGAATAARQSIVFDGGVLTEGGRILAVGPFSELKKEHASYTVFDHQGAILAPALVNGHAHLELSHLAALGREDGETTRPGPASPDYFTDWIRSLISQRHKFAAAAGGNPEAAISASGRRALDTMHRNGIGLAADIGNQAASADIGRDHPIAVIFLLELFGLAGRSQKRALERLSNEPARSSYCTAHAPYSTGPELIRRLKGRSLELGHLFSIHTAETAAEDEFMRRGIGSFRRFLVDVGEWDDSFQVPGTGSVTYLDQLGVLDPATMCVHTVQVTDDEIDVIGKRGARVCLCPGSNRRLGAGKARLADFLARGILPALGTDSLASNSELNLWQEMRLLREDHPGVEPQTIFAMATLGGAVALGAGSEAGSLSPGAPGRFLALAFDRNAAAADEIFEYLTTAVEPADITWVE